MTEEEIKQLYPDFANADEGRLNAAGGVNPMGYQMLRVGQDKLGESSFAVTLRYFHTVGAHVFNELKYIDMTLVNGELEHRREQILLRLLRQTAHILCGRPHHQARPMIPRPPPRWFGMAL